MGRGDKPQKTWSREEWKQEGGQSHHSGGRGPPWRWWPGAFSSPQARAKAGAVKYDQIAVPGRNSSQPHQAVPEESYEGYGAMREVQKALTSARKADNRIRKLREDRAHKEQQWKLYQQKKKEEFLQEERRYKADQQRIEEDIMAQMKLGEESARLVQTLVTHGCAARTEPLVEAEGAWEAMLKGPEDPPATNFLKDALTAAGTMQGLSRPVAGTEGLMRPEAALQLLQATLAQLPPGLLQSGTPVVGGQATTVERVSEAGEPPPVTATKGPTEPYLASPSTRTLEEIWGQPSHSPNTRHKNATRQPVKGGTLQPVHTGTGSGESLGSKLDAKRREALRPFGIPKSEELKEDVLPPQGGEHIDVDQEGPHGGAGNGRSGVSLDGMG